MARPSFHHSQRVFAIVSPDGAVQAEIVPELGGVVSSLRFGDGQERLYLHDWFWDPHTPETRGGMPVLFPICGRLLQDGVPGRYRIDGKPYVLPIHGFAMRRPWEIADATRPDSLLLRLSDSPPTRAIFPFPFELELLYSVSDHEFSCRLTVRNTGDRPMPYAAGFHPYLRIPPPDENKKNTVFQAYPLRRCLYNSTKTDVIGTAPPPAFPMSIADDAVNGLLLDVGERGDSTLAFPDGTTIRQTASPLFRYRQFYSLPNQPFFCDEPWMAPPGALHHPLQAPTLPPGQTDSGTLLIQCLPPGTPPDSSGTPLFHT